MDDAERPVAVSNVVCDDAQREQIVNLIDRDALLFEFQVNRIQPLDTGLGGARNPVLFHLLFDKLRHFGKKRFVLAPVFFDHVLQLLIAFRIDVTESEILEFATDFAHAEAVGERRVNIHGLARNRFATVSGQVGKGPHVVKAVGEFHHDDADIVCHGEQHLAEVLGLLLFLGCEWNLADLGDAIDNVSDFRAKKLFDFLKSGEGILDDVMQQADTDRDRIHLHLGQQVRDFQRMRKVRLA